MFGRRGGIARSIWLFLLATSFFIGAWGQQAPAQTTQPTPPSQQVQVPANSPRSANTADSTTQHKSTARLIAAAIASAGAFLKAVIGTAGVAPILAAIIAGGFAWTIAELFTKRLKQIEASLVFSEQFHELVQKQRALNRKYDRARLNGSVVAAAVDQLDKQDAEAWWWRFFDLLLYEYDFYQKGMIRKERFEEWMVWRWYDFHAAPGKEWKTCGIGYHQAWANWKGDHGSRLIDLLDAIHEIPDEVDLERKARNKLLGEKVRDKIKPFGPRWWRPTALYKAYR